MLEGVGTACLPVRGDYFPGGMGLSTLLAYAVSVLVGGKLCACQMLCFNVTALRTIAEVNAVEAYGLVSPCENV